MKKMRFFLGISLMTIFFLSLSVASKGYATDITEFHEPFVVVSSYSVSNDIINPGEEFELKLVIENMDKSVGTSELLLNLSYSDGINIVYPSVSQIYIGRLKGGESRSVVYKLNCGDSYSSSLARFAVSIVSDNRSTSTSLVAPVKLDTSLFKVLSQDIPEEGIVSEVVSASMLFRSRSADNLSNVVMKVLIDDEEAASSTIGNIYAGASKKQTISFSVPQAGRHDISMMVEYVDVNGVTGAMELYSGQILINESTEKQNELIETNDTNTLSQEDQKRILMCLGASALLLIGIVVIVKKNN